MLFEQCRASSFLIMYPGSEKIQKRAEVLKKEHFYFWPLVWKEAFLKKGCVIYQSCRASVTYTSTNYSTFDHLFLLLWQNFSSASVVLMAVVLKYCVCNGYWSQEKSACFLVFWFSFSIFNVQQGIFSELMISYCKYVHLCLPGSWKYFLTVSIYYQ